MIFLADVAVCVPKVQLTVFETKVTCSSSKSSEHKSHNSDYLLFLAVCGVDRSLGGFIFSFSLHRAQMSPFLLWRDCWRHTGVGSCSQGQHFSWRTYSATPCFLWAAFGFLLFWRPWDRGHLDTWTWGRTEKPALGQVSKRTQVKGVGRDTSAFLDGPSTGRAWIF